MPPERKENIYMLIYMKSDVKNISQILGEEVRCALATRREIGDSIKYQSEILRKALNELQAD